MSLALTWVICGMLICSGPWTDKRRPFLADYLGGLLLIILWPIAFLAIIRGRK